MAQPDNPENLHPRIDGLTGLETRHPQVPLFYYTVDEEIADLIPIMNYCGIRTVNSCQHNNYNRGTVRRVWVEIFGEDLLPFLTMLDNPDEVSDEDSLSHSSATEFNPDNWEDLEHFRENRDWHYRAGVARKDGQLLPLSISIRFPRTDLDEVVARLRQVAKEITRG